MSKQNNKKTLIWIYSRCKRFLPQIILISIFSAVISLSFVYLALLSKNVLEVATGDREGKFLHYALALGFLVVLQVVLSGVDAILKTLVSGKLTISLREYLFSFLCRKKYSQISHYHSGDILNRFTSDTEVIVSNIVNIIPSVASMLAKIIGGTLALVSLEPTIAVIVLVLGICIPALGRMINKHYKYLHKECQRTEGVTRSFMQECFENNVVIKTFISEIPFVNKLEQYMKENFKFKLKRTYVSVAASLSLYSFFTIGYYAVLIWGAGQISSQGITYGTLLAFLQLISQLKAPLQNVSGIMPKYYATLASAERLIEFEDFENEAPALETSELNRIKENFSSLEGKNISFSYSDKPVLENCSFKIEKGSITAIMGESGSGKSTVFKLILGLYEPQSGELTVNGNIKIDTSMRGLFAYVPQGNMVLSGSIRDNISMYNPSVTQEQIINAAKIADIHGYISSLPDGYDTVLAERGAGLSDGQIQRISIARALLTNAPILLLDEATSALDEMTEATVLKNIKELKEKTVLLVTHRSTSLEVCDSIIRVKD